MIYLPILLSLIVDRIIGEPSRYHPLIGFGRFAIKVESALNHPKNQFLKGIAAWLITIIPITFAIYYVDKIIGGIYLSIIVGWLAIGWQSLRLHALAVSQAFIENDIENDLQQARLKTSYLVSRDTTKLDESALSRATIESLLENGSDAIFAPLCFLLLFGAPGIVFYRLCNTLDAMWGYRNQRYEQFGKFTARVDDLLNYIPARLTALLYIVCGNSKQAIKAWKTQGNQWYSPNAGVVMATGAGALNLKLGGVAIYHGKEKQRPDLGYGKSAKPADIQRTIHLLDRSVYLIMGIIVIALFAMH